MGQGKHKKGSNTNGTCERKKKKKKLMVAGGHQFTLRRLRKPNDLLRQLGNTLPTVLWVDSRELLPSSTS